MAIRSPTIVPWNARIPETSSSVWFAITTPITVAAMKPESSRSASAATRVATRTINAAATVWPGAARWRRRSSSQRTPAPTAPAIRPMPRLRARSPTWKSRSPSAPALTALKASTPSRAPIGSMSTPSHLSTDRTPSLGRTNASSGSTTVGPETTSTAPSTADTPQPSPKMSCAATVTPRAVRGTPITINRTTTRWAPPASSWRRSLRPASKRISPTPRVTSG